jgi:formate dehydrogenase subunit gamma
MVATDFSDDATAQAVARAVATATAEGGRALLMPALHALQADLGYVPEPAIALLARAFNVSRADVVGVISFYRDFVTSPPPHPSVRVCRAEACQAVGAEALYAGVRERLGAAAVDEVFCLGNCALGPSVSVAGRVLGRATVARVVGRVHQ